MNSKLLKLYIIPGLIALSCILLYWSFGYALERENAIQLIGLYTALCFLSFKLYKAARDHFKLLVSLAIIFRLVFFIAIPALSQDYFRFVWDGQLINAGINPYQFIPTTIAESWNFSNAEVLLEGMGSLSASHYSNYPPLNQLLFAISTSLGSSVLGSVVFLRSFIILADLGTLYFGSKLLSKLGMPRDKIFLYILNPFIIIEMTSNLHFESVMVFFLVWSLYLLQHKRWIASAIVLGLSISIKLLPLLFLPLFLAFFLKRPGLSFIRLLAFYSAICITVGVSFIPFYSEEVFNNFMASIGLWFGKFEFNASVYYLVRWIGYEVKGYNIIETAGKILPMITITVILVITFLKNKGTMQALLRGMLFAVFTYLLFSTTVHPWYLAIPLVLSVFARYFFVLVWSFVVILSYTAYTHSIYQENLWLVTLEYSIVLGFFVYEVVLNKEIKLLDRAY